MAEREIAINYYDRSGIAERYVFVTKRHYHLGSRYLGNTSIQNNTYLEVESHKLGHILCYLDWSSAVEL